MNEEQRDETNRQNYGFRQDLARGVLQDQTGVFLRKAENMYWPVRIGQPIALENEHNTKSPVDVAHSRPFSVMHYAHLSCA